MSQPLFKVNIFCPVCKQRVEMEPDRFVKSVPVGGRCPICHVYLAWSADRAILVGLKPGGTTDLPPGPIQIKVAEDGK